MSRPVGRPRKYAAVPDGPREDMTFGRHVLDLREFLKDYARVSKDQRPTFESFKTLWKEWGMSHIHEGRRNPTSAQSYMDELCWVVLSPLSEETPLVPRITAIYLLYLLYESQFPSSKVLIKITLPLWDVLKATAREAQTSGLGAPCAILARMLNSEHAFAFHACLGSELYRWAVWTSSGRGRKRPTLGKRSVHEPLAREAGQEYERAKYALVQAMGDSAQPSKLRSVSAAKYDGLMARLTTYEDSRLEQHDPSAGPAVSASANAEAVLHGIQWDDDLLDEEIQGDGGGFGESRGDDDDDGGGDAEFGARATLAARKRKRGNTFDLELSDFDESDGEEFDGGGGGGGGDGGESGGRLLDIMAQSDEGDDDELPMPRKKQKH